MRLYPLSRNGDCVQGENRLQLGVRAFKTLLTLLLLANWFVCTVHCQLEQTGLCKEVATHSAVVGVQTVSDACFDADASVCDWIVSGGLQVSKSRVSAPQFIALPLATFLHDALTDTIKPSPGGDHQSRSVPPELVSSVLFDLRTALPARAPSIIS